MRKVLSVQKSKYVLCMYMCSVLTAVNRNKKFKVNCARCCVNVEIISLCDFFT